MERLVKGVLKVRIARVFNVDQIKGEQQRFD
jgi:hypothetical protein